MSDLHRFVVPCVSASNVFPSARERVHLCLEKVAMRDFIEQVADDLFALSAAPFVNKS